MFTSIAIKRYDPPVPDRRLPMIPISFEFYPPKNEDQRERLDRTASAPASTLALK